MSETHAARNRSARSADDRTSRRDFLKHGTAVALAAPLAAQLGGLAHGAYASGSDVLKVGLVGCGGRGTGAAAQALGADSNTKLVAMADAFADRLEDSLKTLQQSGLGERIDVPPERRFAGFDAYKQVIEASDVVLLCTPPHFRPEQLRACVEAGKHTFVEKPVAVDGPGVRSVIETCELAEQRGLSVVSGLCWRYHEGMRETFNQLHEGTAGDIVAMQCSYNSNGVWEPRKTREECDSDMEYQMRNWYYYKWLSGDFNVEQHVHSLDKMQWAMKDVPPVQASGSGGRIQRTDPKYGDIYDHFCIVYEYPGGVKAFARCRHFRGCTNDVSDHIMGTRGRVDVFRHRIEDLAGNSVWSFRGRSKNMYQQEHDELFASIRAGKPINNGRYMSYSTLMAILGRMVAYTGKTITWDQALNSQERLAPQKYEWSAAPQVQVAIPGVTPFV
ncbi:MAG: Gfo/Idh/MocA family oxidoreductase [Planctomycetes bacterium]|nr:Gfo/Idh/MocA family oxidoreductase [Planctomycetota bacterium]